MVIQATFPLTWLETSLWTMHILNFTAWRRFSIIEINLLERFPDWWLIWSGIKKISSFEWIWSIFTWVKRHGTKITLFISLSICPTCLKIGVGLASRILSHSHPCAKMYIIELSSVGVEIKVVAALLAAILAADWIKQIESKAQMQSLDKLMALCVLMNAAERARRHTLYAIKSHLLWKVGRRARAHHSAIALIFQRCI